MYRLIHFLRGTAVLRIRGAAPEEALTRFGERGIPFWNLQALSPLEVECTLWERDVPRADVLAAGRFCSCRVLRRQGLPALWRGLWKKRAGLLLSMTGALLLSFLLPTRVYFFQVEGAETIPREKILRALEEVGISPGVRGREIDSQLTKHRMLNAVPELSWLAVNQTGLCARVEVTRRREEQMEENRWPAAHIVAARDGILTEVHVYRGMQLCSPGQAVQKGRVLVSGYEDYGLYLRAVRSCGEIYGRTWRTGTVVRPAQTVKKMYTGENFREIWVHVGRKRIKILDNGSNSLTHCDKIVKIKKLTLPGGYSLPLALETVTCRAWEPQQVPMDPALGRELLLRGWLRMTREDMTAGRVENTRESFLRTEDLQILQAESTCTELLGRVVPAPNIYQGEANDRTSN